MAKRRGRKPILEAVPLAVLERVLARRRRVVERMEKRREKLLGRVARIEQQLKALVGEGLPGRAPAAAAPAAPKVVHRRRRGGRRRGADSLPAVVARVLQAASEPLRALNVVEGVIKEGYKSKARNFKQIVHSLLTRHPNAKRVGKGLYVYQAAEPKPGNGRRRKAPAA